MVTPEEIFAVHDEGRAAVTLALKTLEQIRIDYDEGEANLLRGMAYELDSTGITRDEFIARFEAELDKIAQSRKEGRALLAGIFAHLRAFEEEHALTLIAGGR